MPPPAPLSHRGRVPSSRSAPSTLPCGIRLVTEAMADVALGGGRLLGGHRVARRAGRAGRRLALPRAPAVQGDAGAARRRPSPRRSTRWAVTATPSPPRSTRPSTSGSWPSTCDLGLDILSEIMWDPALRPADVDAERTVILDEILMHADEPADLAAERWTSALFPGHPLGPRHPGHGRPACGRRRPTDVRRFFDEHYRPGNMVVSVAGDCDHEAVADAGRARGSPVARAARPPDPPAPAGPAEPLVVRAPADRAGPPGARRCARSPASTRSGGRWPSSTTCWAAGSPAGCSRRSASSGGWPTRSGRTGPPSRTPGRSA